MRTTLALSLALTLSMTASMWAQSAPSSVPAKTYYGVFRELPITDITPEGWLAQWLERQATGLGGHRSASGYPYGTCLWTGAIPADGGRKGQAHWAAYEQAAYLVDGVYRCGLLIQNPALIELGRDNVRYVLDHPQKDGKIGTTDFRKVTGPDGAAGPQSTGDQWPFAVFTRAMMAYYDATQDQALLDALTKHYLALSENFGVYPRDVMNIEGMCWLYDRTGDTRIRDLAERTWRNFAASKTANSRGGQFSLDKLAKQNKLMAHGVTLSEVVKQPALLYLATGKEEYRAAAMGSFCSLYRDHELADGVLSSDPGTSGKSPDHPHETCVAADYSWSLGYMVMLSGESRWADAVERAVLNGALGSVDKEFKSHQYYGVPNQVVATQKSSRPSNGNRKNPFQAYRPDHLPACCTGNIHRMIPNYAARTWMSDGQGGLAAVLYAPSRVHTKVGKSGVPVTVTEKTDYPFDGAIDLTVSTATPVEFPLYVRIPVWASGAIVKVNGQPLGAPVEPGAFCKIQRTFADGDVVRVELPMAVRMESSVAGSASLYRGPVLYALRVKENRKQVPTLANDPAFPGWDLTPASDWNYALALGDGKDLSAVKVDRRAVAGFPWTPDTAPVLLTVPARKVPSWTLTEDGVTPPLPRQPLVADDKVETITLIPYGSTQLRVSVFPVAAVNSSK